MKKKLLLTCLMISLLVIVFAVSAFAEEIIVSKTVSEEYGTVIQLSADPGLDEAKNYVSTLNKINDNGTDTDALCILTDGTYFYVFPSSYIVNERADGVFDLVATALTTAMADFNTANSTSYYEDYEMTGWSTDKLIDEIARFEFTSDVTSISNVLAMRSYPYLVEVRFNYAIDLSGIESLFQKCYKLKTVVGFENVNPTIGNKIFASCSALETIKLPTNITKIPDYMFDSCSKLTIENWLELPNLTTIGKGAFQAGGALNFIVPDSVTTIEENAFVSSFKTGGSITINPTSKLQTIGDSAFNDCRKLKSIYIPSTVTSIGANVFNQCYDLATIENFENCKITIIKENTFKLVTALQDIKIPETVTTIENAFIGNTKLTTVYIPKSVISIADTFVDGSWGNVAPNNAIYVYTGNNASTLSACTRLSGANVIKASEYNPEASYTGVNLVVGYSHCDAYYNGVHGDNVTTVTVASYLAPIQKYSTCVECGYGRETGKIPALFACDGYSTPENGRAELVIGFTVNNEAIKEFEQISKKSLEFGAFAALQAKLNGGYIFDENGNAIANSVVAKIEGYGYGMFELKISGFADNQKDIKLAMGAYVITSDGETTEYSYLQVGTPSANENYAFVSYNDVVNGQSKEEITE